MLSYDVRFEKFAIVISTVRISLLCSVPVVEWWVVLMIGRYITDFARHLFVYGAYVI